MQGARTSIARRLPSVVAPHRLWVRRSVPPPWWCGALCVWFFVLAMLFPWLRAPETAHLLTPPAPYEVAARKVLLLQPVGRLAERDVDFLARALEARSGVPVSILSPVPPPPEAFDFQSGQYDGDALLDWLFVTRPAGAWRVLAVTADNLGTWDTDDVYGYANYREGVAVVSTHHFGGLWSADDEGRALARDQLARVAFHELIHTLGMPHCKSPRCLMSGIRRKRHIRPWTTACERCVKAIDAALAAPRDPHLESLVLGDGFFSRGWSREAWRHYQSARASLPWDASATHQARVENRLAATLIGRELFASAEFHVEQALAMDRGLAAVWFNKALIEVAKGDEAAAFDAMAQGLSLEEDAVVRHEFEATFYLDALEFPAGAFLPLRRYREAGGADPRLLATLARLERQHLVVFNEFEVEVITGDARQVR